jgi:adenine-specific DNA methylase
MSKPVKITNHIIKSGFPVYKNVNPNKLKITDEAIYSISGRTRSLFITNLISKFFSSRNITVTDCTANVGSDTIQFGLNFNKVNSIEFDNENFKALQHNVNMYDLENVKLFKGNSMEIIEDLSQDVIYIDAPWGGRNYKDNKYMNLFMDNMEISEVYNKFKHKATLFVFKVPNNYNFNAFSQVDHDIINVHTYVSSEGNSRFKLILVSKK